MESIIIKSIKNNEDLKPAIKIFSDAFVNDSLFIFAFPDEKKRKRLTKIMYEFVVFELVPLMKLKLKGLYVNNKLVSVCTFTTPESKTEWTDELANAVNKMRKCAKDDSIRLIGEYSMKSRKYKIDKPHIYFNELAVIPKEQGKGYGKMMFEYVESQCRKHSSAKSVWLDTPNPKNVKIYKHFGYSVRHRFKFRRLTGYVMSREIG
jgi:GNAT superfamily N-acetyltransferase